MKFGNSAFLAFIFGLIGVGVSGCYVARYDADIVIDGVVSNLAGAPQRIDINDEILVCVSLRLSRTYYVESGRVSEVLEVCDAVTTSDDGKFHVILQSKESVRATNPQLYLGKRNEITIERVGTYLKLRHSQDSTVTGDVEGFEMVSEQKYTASVKYILNTSQYRPDASIEVNSVEKPYSK